MWFLSFKWVFIYKNLTCIVYTHKHEHLHIHTHIYSRSVTSNYGRDLTQYNFCLCFLCFRPPPFHFLHSHLFFVIGIWKTCVHTGNSTNTLQGKHPDYPNDRHWCVYFIHWTVTANNVIWYRKISSFHALPFLSYWMFFF